MEVNAKEKEGTVVLNVIGRIDAATAPNLDKQLKEIITQGKNKLLLNFAQLSYISSGGLRILLLAAKELQKYNGSLKLCSLNTDVYKVFKLTGCTSIFKIYPGEEEAFS